MKALTVRQPWAWAIIQGGKDVENRTQLWKYRGTLAIHAGAGWSQRGADTEILQRAYAAWLGFTHWGGPYGGRTAMPIDITDPRDAELIHLGAIIGTVELVDVHTADSCEDIDGHCSPWAESRYREAGGAMRNQLVHLVLRDPKPIHPIPCKGMLGLWEVPDDLLAVINGPCESALHDHPLPTAFDAAANEATLRLDEGWNNPKCPYCGRYGWREPDEAT